MQLPNWKPGQDIVERYVKKENLPDVGGEVTSGRACCTHQGVVHVGPRTSASVVAHEIVHAIEMQKPDVMEKSRRFLQGRRKGQEKPQRLRKLTGISYESWEITLEDEWAARGGNPYAGKLYFPGVSYPPSARIWKQLLAADEGQAFDLCNATELLTMGIERLHKDPVKFYREDEEYFRFVVSTLQDL